MAGYREALHCKLAEGIDLVPDSCMYSISLTSNTANETRWHSEYCSHYLRNLMLTAMDFPGGLLGRFIVTQTNSLEEFAESVVEVSPWESILNPL